MEKNEKKIENGDASHVFEKIGAGMERARGEISAHPLAYVAVAAGVGVAAGYLIKHLNKEECRCD